MQKSEEISSSKSVLADQEITYSIEVVRTQAIEDKSPVKQSAIKPMPASADMGYIEAWLLSQSICTGIETVCEKEPDVAITRAVVSPVIACKYFVEVEAEFFLSPE
jgi:hypothetical protein